MIIFLRNIPGDTSRSEIVEFVTPAIKTWWFRKKGEIVKVEMLCLRNTYNKLTEYHGLVHIKPDLAAQRAIKKLNGKFFRGKRILVRQYFIRSGTDRRSQQQNVSPEILDKRRIPTRRREMEIVEMPFFNY